MGYFLLIPGVWGWIILGILILFDVVEAILKKPLPLIIITILYFLGCFLKEHDWIMADGGTTISIILAVLIIIALGIFGYYLSRE